MYFCKNMKSFNFSLPQCLKYLMISTSFLSMMDSDAQNEKIHDTKKYSTYLAPYAGVLFQRSQNVSLNSNVYKIGKFNYFNTDFDLIVDLIGKTDNTTGSIGGLTYGTLWHNDHSKFKHGFELDLFYKRSDHNSKLDNPDVEQIKNVNGPNIDSIINFINKEFCVHCHKFHNTMTMSSWNTAVNYILSYVISKKVSINGAVGLGLSFISLGNAVGLQEEPASPGEIYEFTKDNGGGPVNHFNSQPNANSKTVFAQFRFGTRIQLHHKLELLVDTRCIYQGASKYTFGSTVYSDHSPTDSWQYSIDNGWGFSLTTGLVFTF